MPLYGSGYTRSICGFATSVTESLFVLVNEYITVRFQDSAVVKLRTSL